MWSRVLYSADHRSMFYRTRLDGMLERNNIDDLVTSFLGTIRIIDLIQRHLAFDGNLTKQAIRRVPGFGARTRDLLRRSPTTVPPGHDRMMYELNSEFSNNVLSKGARVISWSAIVKGSPIGEMESMPHFTYALGVAIQPLRSTCERAIRHDALNFLPFTLGTIGTGHWFQNHLRRCFSPQ
jgi:hypothetical protein